MQLPEVSKKNLAIIFTLSVVGVIFLGLAIAWFNTGDIYTGLHDYGMAIIVMVVGVILIFIDKTTVKTIGTMLFVSGLLFTLMGARI